MSVEGIVPAIDSLEVGRPHYRVWIIASLGFLLEAVDLTIAGAVLTVLIKQFHISSLEVGTLGSAALLGYLIGVAIAGIAADQLGRSFVMRITVLVFTIFTLIAAFSWNATSFGLFRFIAGIGIGGEAALLTPYLAEIMPAKVRGRLTGLGQTFFSVGLPLAALINLLIIPTGPNGWRTALIVAGIPAVYVVVMRRYLPETPRWLALRGKYGEAARVMRSLGGTWSASSESQPVRRDGRDRSSALAPLVGIWSRHMAGKTSLIWVTWFCIQIIYYAFLTWLPTLLVKKGFTLVHSLEYTLIINLGAVVGGVAASMLQDGRLGRRFTLAIFFLLSALSSLWFAGAATVAAVILSGSALSLFVNGSFAVLYTLTPEQYPTEMRGAGQGMASMFGHIGSVFGPIGVGALLPTFGVAGVFGSGAAMLFLAFLCVLGLRETRGKGMVEQLT